MSAEETSEVPNWLAKLEEQRERRLKVKLGHEAGAGAPCQNCGDKCPGLDLHFWRKICKLCKCKKEDHDISDDDIYGFVQFQLLGSKPSKAKSIFLSGKKDAITLDWTPKGSNTDVKKYLEELPEDLLPIKGSEAARTRKQRLQKQMPAHDIDASLCHALSPEEIQQLEEYVSHIRKYSVGQGKIIQITLLRGKQHKLANANPQYLTQHNQGQVASSQPVYLQSSNLMNNLQNLSLHDKQVPNNRAAFLNSQLPNTPVINTIDEHQPETISYRTENMKVVPNYAPKNLHQIVDNQSPISLGKTNDLKYPVQSNAPGVTNNYANPAFLNKPDNLHAYNPVSGEKYYGQNPEYASKMAQNPEYRGKIIQNPQHKNSDSFGNMQDPILSEKYKSQNPEYAGKMARGPYSVDESKHKLPNPNINLIHSTSANQNPGMMSNYGTQNPDLSGKGYVPQGAFPGRNAEAIQNALPQNIDMSGNKELGTFPNNASDKQTIQNAPYMIKNIDPLTKTGYGGQNTFSDPNNPFSNQNTLGTAGEGYPNIYSEQNLPQNKGYVSPNMNKYGPLNKNLEDFEDQNVDPNIHFAHSKQESLGPHESYPNTLPYNYDRHTNIQEPITGSNYGLKNPEYAGKLGNYNETGQLPDYSENPPIQLPLTTSNVERHQEQFQDYPQTLCGTEFKNRVPIPVFNAENRINPVEFEQNISSVGYIRDIDYNIPKIPNDTDLVNSNVIPTCHRCNKLFEDGAFAVTVERTDSLWHAACFTCHSCDQPLADLLYFYHKDSDDIYCGRDYAILKGIPRCAACDELIFVREYCLAEERTFHIKHFCCFECDEPLAGKQYVMENDQPNCVACYEKLKAEKCNDCGFVIGPEEQGVSLQNLHWHATDSCFVCKYCRKGLLGGGKMLLKNQNIFCSEICYKTYHA